MTSVQDALLQALKTEDEARECEECGSESGKGKEAGSARAFREVQRCQHAGFVPEKPVWAS